MHAAVARVEMQRGVGVVDVDERGAEHLDRRALVVLDAHLARKGTGPAATVELRGRPADCCQHVEAVVVGCDDHVLAVRLRATPHDAQELVVKDDDEEVAQAATG